MFHTDIPPIANFLRSNTQRRQDSLWIGDNISTTKDPLTTRLMFHNINGLPLQGNESLDMLVNEQETLEVDIQGMTEHCLDTTKYQVYQTAQDIVRNQTQLQSLLVLHSSIEPAEHLYKPGGTGFLVLGDVVSRLETNGVYGDAMGRWSALHLRRHNQFPLTIITAYQVCPRPTNMLGNTAYHQQVRALGTAGLSTTHPRTAFITALDHYISQLQSKGHAIVLGGDFNEALTDKNSGILRLITARNLTDPFLHRYSHLPTFGTHEHGTRRIDLVFVSPELLPFVTGIGYAPYHYSKPSDHRPLLLEMNTRQLFGLSQIPMLPSGARRLRSKDKAAVANFITQWFNGLSSQQCFAKQQQVDDDQAGPEILELLDSIIGHSGEQAEQQCRRRRPEFYSQALTQQRVRVSVLRSHLRSLRLGMNRTPALLARTQRLGLEQQFPTTIRNTLQQLNLEIDKLRQMRADHKELRQQELAARIEEATSRGNKTAAQVLRAIKKTEMHQQTYKILRNMKRRNHPQSAINTIEIPRTWPAPYTPIGSIPTLDDPKLCTEWRTVTHPGEIEYYLILRNRKHFGQAEGTPFTCEPLRSDIDWGATTEASSMILDGNYGGTVSTPNCHDLLQACKRATSLDSLPAELTMDEFRGKIRSWKETTTTSPSGRHLGWYKALLVPLSCMDQSEAPETSLTTMQESITSLIVSIINYCIRNTYVLDRWKKIVNVMLCKEPGNYKIHRLRIIHIYEADFNLLLAVKWRQLLRTADAQSLIHEGQYGGRPGCEPQSLTLLEELKYDLAYLTRRTLFNFDNDAASCYDRIVVPFASIVNRKYGLHRKVVAIHADTLQTARYHLKTANGISDQHYTTSNQYPIHGTGQGSGNSPSIWLFISSTLFDIHSSKAQGASFVSPDGQLRTSFSMVGFVDDSTGSCNDFQPQHEAPIQELIQRMQSDAQLWNNLLYCTGGKLELQKCSFHVLRFEFLPSGKPLPVIDSFNNAIQVVDLELETPVPIPSKRAFDPHRTLGHYKSPASRARKAIQQIQEKANHLALLISVSPLTRPGAFLAYQTVYIPSIKYTLPQSFFTHQELQKAQAASLSLIIAKCGYNRHMPRAVMFAPRTLGGGGFLPWYLMQGEGQILHFVKHWRTNTIVSKTLKVAIMWAQWQSGHSQFILADAISHLPYLECRWINSLRTFLKDIGGSFQVDMSLVPRRERQGDQYIMDLANASGMFNDQELAIINYCRLYLHVTTISEMLDSTGQYIIPDLFRCRREPWFNPGTILTLQRRPSEFQVRKVWQRFCRQWTTSSGRLGLTFKLGKWLHSGHELRRWRQAYYDPMTPAIIYKWTSDCYWAFRREASNDTTYRSDSPTDWTPTRACSPIDTTQMSATVINTTVAPRLRVPVPISTHPATFTSYIQRLPTWERSLLEGAQLHFPPFEMHNKITNSSTATILLAVSDGSVRDSNMTFGWVIGSDNGTIYAQHSGAGYGQATSHRAEAWGMLSMLDFLYHLSIFTSPSRIVAPCPRDLVILCDNQSLVTRVTQRQEYAHPYPNTTLIPDWDVTEQIHVVFNHLQYSKKQFQWIRGHQDDSSEELSVPAQFNVLADNLAASAHQACPPSKSLFLPAGKCILFINHNMVTGQYTQTLRETFTVPAYKSYIAHRHEWTADQLASIDWEAFRSASSRISQSSVQMVKFLHDKLPTNYEISKSNPHHSSACSYCDEVETFHHLLCCHNPSSAEFRRTLIHSIETYMRTRKVPARFQHEFTECLVSCLSSSTDRSPSSELARQQLQLGPRAFMKGFLRAEWTNSLSRQIIVHTDQSSRQVAHNIILGLIKILWEAQLTMWTTHLEALNIKKDGRTQSISARHATYVQRIRQLYFTRDECLPAHQHQYFPEDLDHFLTKATTTQLRQYLFQYESAIIQSKKANQRNILRPLTSFPGFFKQRPSPQPQPTSHQPTAQHRLVPLPGVRGAPNHHKHTRWRPLQTFQQSIRNFFFPSDAPD